MIAIIIPSQSQMRKNLKIKYCVNRNYYLLKKSTEIIKIAGTSYSKFPFWTDQYMRHSLLPQKVLIENNGCVLLTAILVELQKN